MKRLTFSFSILFLAFMWIYYTAATDYTPAINPVIGDISYIKKFGHLPSPGTDHDLRIKTHLAYAESLLRETGTEYGNKELRLKRGEILDHLRIYWLQGVFPKKHDCNHQSNPCFIDNLGRISALGYLIEKSINKQMDGNNEIEFSHSEIVKMDTQSLNDWIVNNGFTREEVAIIQPTYN